MHAAEPKTRRARRPLTAEQQALAAKYLPMAKALARPMQQAWPGAADDLMSAAQMGLVEAAAAFDPARNVKFSTFARHRVLGSLLDVRRRLRATGWRDDRGQPPRVVQIPRRYLGPEQPLGGTHRREAFGPQAERPVGWELEAKDEADWLLRTLPPRTAAACRHLFLDGRNQTEAGDALGCHQSRVSTLLRNARARIARDRAEKPSAN